MLRFFYKTLLLCLMVVIILVGCTNAQQHSFPLNLIHEDFGMRPFDIPEGWEVYFLMQKLKPVSINLQEPEKSIFEDYPYEVIIGFGRVAEVNEIDIDTLREKEQQDYTTGEDTLYYVSYDQVYATLEIMHNDSDELTETGLPTRFAQMYSQAMEREDEFVTQFRSNGKVVHAFHYVESSAWFCIWTSADNSLSYMLRIHGEITALSKDEQSLEGIINIVEQLSRER